MDCDDRVLLRLVHETTCEPWRTLDVRLISWGFLLPDKCLVDKSLGILVRILYLFVYYILKSYQLLIVIFGTLSVIIL